MQPVHEPNSRQLVGIFGIIAWIIVWAGIVASFSSTIGQWHMLLQAVFYLVVGLIWIAPLKPALRWMQTGKFKA
ncbi:DUF2842 domain-containing protein [Sphingomicrobium clamense]|uniref:DUF2842 domain-containing protein n=1 Tax=Sphingomicrobium clamense TaxID=2851013 RepID=A0ABS6V5V0_9SPHN|nr:DUF2842 domain-containing protein [Sphingomicrobium sp. B8]MBW0144894.1 DUF2842 domain-containing protein [Sphingomicrobium sp. B8]